MEMRSNEVQENLVYLSVMIKMLKWKLLVKGHFSGTVLVILASQNLSNKPFICDFSSNTFMHQIALLTFKSLDETQIRTIRRFCWPTGHMREISNPTFTLGAVVLFPLRFRAKYQACNSCRIKTPWLTKVDVDESFDRSIDISPGSFVQLPS